MLCIYCSFFIYMNMNLKKFEIQVTSKPVKLASLKNARLIHPRDHESYVLICNQKSKYVFKL